MNNEIRLQYFHCLHFFVPVHSPTGILRIRPVSIKKNKLDVLNLAYTQILKQQLHLPRTIYSSGYTLPPPMANSARYTLPPSNANSS